MLKKLIGWLVVAGALIAIGGIVFTVTMAANGWNFGKIGTKRMETKTYDFVDEFDDIKIDAITSDVNFKVSANNKCKVVCEEDKKVVHEVKVENNVLSIVSHQVEDWKSNINFSFKSEKITVYLPKTSYESLNIKLTTGDINIGKDFNFYSADFDVTTGDINFSSTVRKDLTIGCTTGEVNISTTNIGNLVSTGTTGNVILRNVRVLRNLNLERSTGDVIFDDFDAHDIFIETTTGDVTGTIASEKIFDVETTTGSVNIPSTYTGGKCEIRTTTGNVNLKIK